MAGSSGDTCCHQLDTIKTDSASLNSYQRSQGVATSTTLESDCLRSNPNPDGHLLCNLRKVA